jgi:SNF2 family DNA or RNA helicase
MSKSIFAGKLEALLGAIWESPGLNEMHFRDGSRPFKHQIEDAQQFCRDGRGILASEMGTGKTRSVLLTCRMINAATHWPIFVICPSSLTTNWQREASVVGVRVSTFSWAKIPPPLPEDFPFILVGDEIQAIQNTTAQRTKAFLRWAATARAVFGISGTPTKNGRPREMFAILRALGHPIAKDSKEFDQKFCGGYLRKIKKKPSKKYPKGKTIRFWDNRGATRVDELNKILGGFTIRRLKKDCLDLPEKTRKVISIETTPEEATAYKRALECAMDQAQAAADEGGDPGTLAIRALSETRQLCSAWKVAPVLRITRDLIAQGHKVLVFSHFQETAKKIAAGLKCRIFTGKTPKPKRQEIVDAFQAGEAEAISFTYAGGVGLTLTQASYVILTDRPWTLADAEQAEDRAHRSGQFNPVTAIWPRMFSIDEEVDRCILAKGELASRLIDGKGLGSQGNLAVEVLKRLWRRHFSED